ncbi:serine/threonine protein phosphatase [Luteimicrobium sp. DT211]|uniref:serine/threonine protein phosphatase n=1 Tax=Luteimicrobium sp. DT211 TaxID=3393412 RepID=UPI003CF8F0AB
MLTDRHDRHHRISASLPTRGDDELAALLATGTDNGVGAGGGTSVIDVDGVAVFAKRIPITDRELARPRSTANLFDLPTYCQYGMYPLAGPGFGAWRELAADEIVTAGVLAGESDAFPLLYGWRVLPGRPPVAAEHLDVDAVVAQFGGAPGVRTRFAELAAATASLVLFLEHVPAPVTDLLGDPAVPVESVERQLLDMVAFLRRRELLHLDGHFGNMRADGDRIRLTDFGLATSPRFDLSDAERAFVARNVDHDADYAAMRLVNWLVTTVCGVPVPETGGPVVRNAFVRACADGAIPDDVPEVVAGVLTRHAAAAARMNDFCWRLFDGDLHAEYPC